MKGFTLIELIVTVSIIMLITVGALANYFWFDASQRLNAETRDLVSLIQRTRARAMALEYPEGCTGLRSYTITGSAVDGSFLVKANCSDSIYSDEPVTVLRSSALSQNLSVTFLAQTGEIDSGVNASIVIRNLRDSSLTKTILIDAYVVDNLQITE